MVKAVPRPMSSLMLQLLSGSHIPPTGARPDKYTNTVWKTNPAMDWIHFHSTVLVVFWSFSIVQIPFFTKENTFLVSVYWMLYYLFELPRVSQGLFFWIQMSYLLTEIQKKKKQLQIIAFLWKLVLAQTCHGHILGGRHADMLWTDGSSSRQI